MEEVDILHGERSQDSWIMQRYRNITRIITSVLPEIEKVSWCAVTGLLVFAYPFALGIVDDRYLMSLV